MTLKPHWHSACTLVVRVCAPIAATLGVSRATACRVLAAQNHNSPS